MKNTFRRFDVERSFWYETHDKDGNVRPDAPTVDEWKKQVLAQWTDFEKLEADECLIAFHDLDMHPDTGEAKPLHAHGVIHFVNAHSEQAVAELMHVSGRKNCQHCKNYSGSVQYLIHVTQDAINEEKHIYPVETIQGFALDENKEKVQLTREEIQHRMVRKTSKKKQEDEQVKSELIADVMEGRKTIPEVREVYKTDEVGIGLNLLKFQKDKSMYVSAEREYLEECARFYQSHNHPMSLIYITGNGGLGKNQLAMEIANMLADGRGVHMVGAPGKSTTFDFAGTYNGQKVSFVDEAKPEAMHLEQFLSVFDSLHAKTVNSRHYEKAYFPDAAIFAASMPIEKFAYQLWKPYAQVNAQLPTHIRHRLLTASSEADWHREYIMSPGGFDIGNKFYQFRRRFAVYVVLNDNHTADVYVLDNKANPPYSLLFKDPLFPQQQPFVRRYSCIYDVRGDYATFAKQCHQLAKLVLEAADYYYTFNGFIKPSDCPKPFDQPVSAKSKPKSKHNKQASAAAAQLPEVHLQWGQDTSDFVEILPG